MRLGLCHLHLKNLSYPLSHCHLHSYQPATPSLRHDVQSLLTIVGLVTMKDSDTDSRVEHRKAQTTRQTHSRISKKKSPNSRIPFLIYPPSYLCNMMVRHGQSQSITLSTCTVSTCERRRTGVASERSEVTCKHVTWYKARDLHILHNYPFFIFPQHPLSSPCRRSIFRCVSHVGSRDPAQGQGCLCGTGSTASPVFATWLATNSVIMSCMICFI